MKLEAKVAVLTHRKWVKDMDTAVTPDARTNTRIPTLTTVTARTDSKQLLDRDSTAHGDLKRNSLQDRTVLTAIANNLLLWLVVHMDLRNLITVVLLVSRKTPLKDRNVHSVTRRRTSAMENALLVSRVKQLERVVQLVLRDRQLLEPVAHSDTLKPTLLLADAPRDSKRVKLVVH